MIEFLSAPDHVIAVKISGALSGEDIDAMMQVVDAKLATHQHLSVLVDMTGFDDLTAEALVKDLRYDVVRMGQWMRFKREALVTDKNWLRWWVKTLSPMAPFGQIRGFERAQREEALAWASAL